MLVEGILFLDSRLAIEKHEFLCHREPRGSGNLFPLVSLRAQRGNPLGEKMNLFLRDCIASPAMTFILSMKFILYY